MKLHFKIAAVLLLLSPFMVAQASTIFFAEDVGNGETATPTTFPESTQARAEFIDSLTSNDYGYDEEDFEVFNIGATSPSNMSFFGGDTTGEITGTGKVKAVADGDADGTGHFGVTGDPDGDGYDQYWEANKSFTITFDESINAFGFFGIDIGDFEGGFYILVDGKKIDIPMTTGANHGNVLFWGIIAQNGFTEIEFNVDSPFDQDYAGFDGFIVGKVQHANVPGPGSLFLLCAGLGLVGLGVAKHRRQSDKALMLGV